MPDVLAVTFEAIKGGLGSEKGGGMEYGYLVEQDRWGVSALWQSGYLSRQDSADPESLLFDIGSNQLL